MKKKQLFDLVKSLGEGIYKSIHVIDLSSNFDVKYRVYHSLGYCFHIEKHFNSDDYYFDSTLFEGFKSIDVESAIILLQNKSK